MTPNQTLSAGEMVGRDTDNLNVAGRDIDEETGTLQASVFTVKKATSNLHGKDRLHFHEAELRDSNLLDRKSTRLNSSHGSISYAVFCWKKKNSLYFVIYAELIHIFFEFSLSRRDFGQQRQRCLPHDVSNWKAPSRYFF